MLALVTSAKCELSSTVYFSAFRCREFFLFLSNFFRKKSSLFLFFRHIKCIRNLILIWQRLRQNSGELSIYAGAESGKAGEAST